VRYLKEDIKSLLIGFIIIYILFGFFPGAQIKYISPIDSSEFLASLDYFIKNFFHLWKVKILGGVVFVFISRFIKYKKMGKINKGR
jgi:hypothetical protein